MTRREQLARLRLPNPGVMYSREGAGFTEFLQVEQPLPLFGVRARAVARRRRGDRRGRSRPGCTPLDAASGCGRRGRTADRRDRTAAGGRVSYPADRAADRHPAHARARRRGLAVRPASRRAGAPRRAAVAHRRGGSPLPKRERPSRRMLPRETPLGRVVSARGHPTARALPVDALMARARSTRAELRALERAGSRTDLRGGRGPAGTLARADRLRRPEACGGSSGNGTAACSASTSRCPLFDAGGREAARWAAERSRIDAERVALGEQIRAEITRASEAAGAAADRRVRGPGSGR